MAWVPRHIPVKTAPHIVPPLSPPSQKGLTYEGQENRTGHYFRHYAVFESCGGKPPDFGWLMRRNRARGLLVVDWAGLCLLCKELVGTHSAVPQLWE